MKYYAELVDGTVVEIEGESAMDALLKVDEEDTNDLAEIYYLDSSGIKVTVFSWREL